MFSCCLGSKNVGAKRSNNAGAQDVAELDLCHSSLDRVPADIFVLERTLERLFLQCNNIRELPRELFQCHEITQLNVADNDIHSLPAAISSLSQLTELNVSKNVLTEIPDTIKHLKHLAILDASVNPLQKIPEGCTQLLSITELYLNDTFLEFLPANFGRLAKLKILELRENGMSTLPKSLCRLTQLQRLDLGQNDFAELPDVVGSLIELTELWLDGNRIRQVTPIIGNLTKLNHLELSFNQVESVSEAISQCKALQHLGLNTNDLRSLPDGVCQLQELVTLKLEDNQLEELPQNLGHLSQLEELILSQNYLTFLPTSIGLCRRLHTLNVDDNDIEFLPSELGSCGSLRILSAHGNRLVTLPAELDHISELAVLNLTGNMIQHLPVSFMKLRNIAALWLSENQTKPLIQLNQDTDPETGNRILTNFMLPQQPESSRDDEDKASESGSFHASVWEEERARKSMVKWASEAPKKIKNTSSSSEDDKNSGESLRREPTPFPKEMRAMAKRVQKLRSKKDTIYPSHQQMRSRSNSRSPPPPSRRDDIGLGPEIRKAKVSISQASPVVSEKHVMSVFRDEKTIREQIELQQFEELERSVSIDHSKTNPEKESDSKSQPTVNQRKPSDPLPQAPVGRSDERPQGMGKAKQPPPYHIAAAHSKHARTFDSVHHRDEARANHSDNTSMSEQSEHSTQASSLQTILKAPNGLNTSQTSSNYESSDADAMHAKHLRKVSEQLLANPRTRQSFTGIPIFTSRPGSFASPKGSEDLPVNSRIPVVIANNQMSRSPLHKALLNQSISSSISPQDFPPSTPRSMTPMAESNGLLTTIERAAHSDDEEEDRASVEYPLPDRASVEYPLPSYENVSNVSSTSSGIPQRKDQLMNTSRFVISNNNNRASPVASGDRSRLPKPIL